MQEKMQENARTERLLNLLNLFMNRVLVAMGTELFQFDPVGGIPTVLGGGVARHSGRSLVRIGAALSTLQRNNDTNALSHSESSPAESVIKHKPLFFHIGGKIDNFLP